MPLLLYCFAALTKSPIDEPKWTQTLQRMGPYSAQYLTLTDGPYVYPSRRVTADTEIGHDNTCSSSRAASFHECSGPAPLSTT
jgi:hypothetical protein